MTHGLRAAWLGSWEVPWSLDRGRRWGDPRWALAALSQAWLLGGRERRWPRATWRARPPRGPWLDGEVEGAGPIPELSWIGLLRHGSTRVPAHSRRAEEDPVRAWAWEALLEGDGTPWMALGSVLLSLEERLAWIPLLGAVDEGGRLHLPPYLSCLIPDAILALPPGWWERLLGDMDPEGRLLPRDATQGPPALALIRDIGISSLEPLVGTGEAPPNSMPLTPGTWIMEPRIRAWARGWGAAPKALAALHCHGLSQGGPPSPPICCILEGAVPKEGLSPEWIEALQKDTEAQPVEQPPPPTEDPTLDRIRFRWVDELPPEAEGYPPWGTRAHPCADPFHWMAEGFRSFRLGQIEVALRAFGWANLHFARMKSRAWAQRAAANAWLSSSLWADVEAMQSWGKIKGKTLSPQMEYEEAWEAASKCELEKAVRLLHSILIKYPNHTPSQIILGNLCVIFLDLNYLNYVTSLLPPEPNLNLYRSTLNNNTDCSFESDHEEIRLMWEAVKARRGLPPAPDLWETLDAIPNQLIRIDVALTVLEHRPEDRTPQRLLALQAIADRSRSPRRQAKLRALWPQIPTEAVLPPEDLVQHWVERRPHPTWVLVGEHVLGPSVPPPQGLVGRLREAGHLDPVPMDGMVWWGDRILWEGALVGCFLASAPVESPLPDALELHLLGPWLGAMRPTLPAEAWPEAQHFPSDGSEPMATLLQEAARVAPTTLPVLILGPSGTGKELMARELHAWSERTGHLVAVNCSAFAEGVLESELFGHVKGAYTGADRDRKGAIEMAEGGTLFLDEVADMSPRIQSMFLRVLQEREVRRVGSERTQRVDVRFLAATHKSLDALVAAGAFRHDLLYRLQGAVLKLPSLSERRHELPILLPRMAHAASKSLRRHAPPLASHLAEALGEVPWPGNFRQLQHALERAMLRCGDGVLGPEHFPELQAQETLQGTWETATAAFQQRLLRAALERHGWKVAPAARDLGLSPVALYAALKRLQVDLPAERHQARLRSH